MQKKYPRLQVESVAKTPIAGLYEVFAGGEVLYVDENVDYNTLSVFTVHRITVKRASPRRSA